MHAPVAVLPAWFRTRLAAALTVAAVGALAVVMQPTAPAHRPAPAPAPVPAERPRCGMVQHGDHVVRRGEPAPRFAQPPPPAPAGRAYTVEIVPLERVPAIVVE